MKRILRQRISLVARKSVSMPVPVPGSLMVLLSAILFFTNVGFIEAEPISDTPGFRSHIKQWNIDRSAVLTGSSVRGSSIRGLIEDVDRNCMPIVEQMSTLGLSSESREQLQLREAVETVQKSEIGSWLLKFAADQQVLICVDHTTHLEAHYRSHLRVIGLSSRLSSAGRVVFLAHELAHVPQHPKFSNNRRLSPMDMLLLQRTREAAAEAIATRVLWQLRGQGMEAPWHEKLTTAYRDIANAFEAKMAESQSNQRELSATRSAFHQWFEASWRLEIYDNLMIKTLSRIANESAGLAPSSLKLSEDYLVGIADYAGRSFLLNGDGQLLIKSFRAHNLPAKLRAQLDEMLARTGNAAKETLLSSVKNEVDSASIPKIAAR